MCAIWRVRLHKYGGLGGEGEGESVSEATMLKGGMDSLAPPMPPGDWTNTGCWVSGNESTCQFSIYRVLTKKVLLHGDVAQLFLDCTISEQKRGWESCH